MPEPKKTAPQAPVEPPVAPQEPPVAPQEPPAAAGTSGRPSGGLSEQQAATLAALKTRREALRLRMAESITFYDAREAQRLDRAIADIEALKAE